MILNAALISLRSDDLFQKHAFGRVGRIGVKFNPERRLSIHGPGLGAYVKLALASPAFSKVGSDKLPNICGL